MNRKDVGYVYVVGEDGRVKIGASKYPLDRARKVLRQGGMSENSNKFVSNKSFSHYKLEALAHNKFKENSISGEWFDVKFEDAVSYVRQIAHKMSASEMRISRAQNAKYKEEKNKQLQSLNNALLKRQSGTEQQYNLILKDTIEMSMVIDNASYSDRLMNCNGDLLKLITIRSLIQSELISELANLLGFEG